MSNVASCIVAKRMAWRTVWCKSWEKSCSERTQRQRHDSSFTEEQEERREIPHVNVMSVCCNVPLCLTHHINECITLILSHLHWLPIQHRMHRMILLIAHRPHQNHAPPNLSEPLQRHYRCHLRLSNANLLATTIRPKHPLSKHP